MGEIDGALQLGRAVLERDDALRALVPLGVDHGVSRGMGIAALRYWGDVVSGSTGMVAAVSGDFILAFGHATGLDHGRVAYAMAAAPVIGIGGRSGQRELVSDCGPVIGVFFLSTTDGIVGRCGVSPRVTAVEVSLRIHGSVAQRTMRVCVARDSPHFPQDLSAAIAACLGRLADLTNAVSVQVQLAVGGIAEVRESLEPSPSRVAPMDTGALSRLLEKISGRFAARDARPDQIEADVQVGDPVEKSK